MVWQSFVTFLFYTELLCIFLCVLFEFHTLLRLHLEETLLLSIHFSHKILQIWDRAHFFYQKGIWVQIQIKHYYSLGIHLVKLFLEHFFGFSPDSVNFQGSRNCAILGMTAQWLILYTEHRCVKDLLWVHQMTLTCVGASSSVRDQSRLCDSITETW